MTGYTRKINFVQKTRTIIQFIEMIYNAIAICREIRVEIE